MVEAVPHGGGLRGVMDRVHLCPEMVVLDGEADGGENMLVKTTSDMHVEQTEIP